jgi:hypothetical protein
VNSAFCLNGFNNIKNINYCYREHRWLGSFVCLFDVNSGGKQATAAKLFKKHRK